GQGDRRPRGRPGAGEGRRPHRRHRHRDRPGDALRRGGRLVGRPGAGGFHAAGRPGSPRALRRGAAPPASGRRVMPVRIGVNPIGWTNDDLHELGGDTPLEVCLDEARQAGYAGIELGRKFPRRTTELRPILARHGLALVSGWYGAELRTRTAAAEIRALADHLALLADLGSTVLVFAETSDSV